MSEQKQVKVDNWGIYFLQRLKHFFNRTDYCDLTLQFQDNAQLKVHRLVLSACTEYFELLERTCEMYEDCLIMPDDLQADVVIPIVNFMYTGQLEFKDELLERLYQTSQIMNMPILTKLLDAQRGQVKPKRPTHSYSAKRFKNHDIKKHIKQTVAAPSTSTSSSNKRSHSKAFDDYEKSNQSVIISTNTFNESFTEVINRRKNMLAEPRPTRYELPEELDEDNTFFNSFSNISYTSQPLMVHPETSKQNKKKTGIFGCTATAKIYGQGTSTLDIVECKKISKSENVFDDHITDNIPEEQMFDSSALNMKRPRIDSNQLFDKILDEDESPKLTIENSEMHSNIDHAKIISEVLKKYPHLVKNNKNIKLKIVNTSSKSNKKPIKHEKKETKSEVPSFTYESDVLDSKSAAQLIALGAENTKGPWICLICGTPGKALHFTSYYIFRRHLVEVHNEKPVSNICEHCGLKSSKRNYLLHHLYTKHGVEPPSTYKFPKCNQCNYIALTEGFLVKHKMSHSEENFRCNVCGARFKSTNHLLRHIQQTGHKVRADRKPHHQCIYCFRSFLREPNLYAHIKTQHKSVARADGVIDDSDDEEQEQKLERRSNIVKPDHIKYEPDPSSDNEYKDEQEYQFEQEQSDSDIQLNTKKSRHAPSSPRQKILNVVFSTEAKKVMPAHEIFEDRIPSANTNQNEDIVIIGDTKYIMRDNQLIPRKSKDSANEEYIISDMIEKTTDSPLPSNPSTSMGYCSANFDGHFKKSHNRNEPIQIVVSNNEEYSALVSNNHSILYEDDDDNNSSKTLTVLTTPQTAPLETTSIDLENNQSNEMMIIQDNYPLNVSQTISGNNSNIVVVYSHSVDQNKSYQIITTQGIESQLVPTSADMSQRFEPVTTTTPLMSAGIIQTKVEETWESDVQQNIDRDTVVALALETGQELMEIDQSTSEVIQDTEEVISEFPEVHISNERENFLTEKEDNVEKMENQLKPPENQTQPNKESVETLQEITTMDTDEQIELVPEKLKNVISKDIETVNQNVSKPTSVIVESSQAEVLPKSPSEVNQTEDCNQVQTETEEQLNEEDVEHSQPEFIEPIISDELPVITPEGHKSNIIVQLDESLTNNDNAMTKVNNQDESTKNDSKIGEELSAQIQNDGHDFILLNFNEEVSKEADKQIQSLASEWSEDEEATVAQETESQSKELEESIENIQQEIEKDKPKSRSRSISPEAQPTAENSLHSKTAIVNKIEVPQEKISSLLNDWEENDSQEENAVTNCNEESGSEPSADVKSQTAENTESTTSSDPKPKTENIKSLVSDWDEEEED